MGRPARPLPPQGVALAPARPLRRPEKSDRKALRKAASLLRIADALDYTHTGVVGNLAVAVKKRKVIIAVQCSGDCSAEMERVIKKGDLFMHVFGRELECVCQGN